jgi:hypothetical protein
MTRISKKRTVARIRWSRGRRKASATCVKVAGIGTSNIKAKELDSPLAWGAGGGSWVHTNDEGSGGGRRHRQLGGIRQEQQGQ